MPNVEWAWRVTDLAAAWALTYLVHSTVILLGVWVLASRRFVGDAARDILWKSALVGGIVTATVQTSMTREPLGGQLRVSSLTGTARPAMRFAMHRDVTSGGRRVVVMGPDGTRWTAGLVTLWLTAAGAALLWLTAGHSRALRALGDRLPLDGTPIDDRLQALRTRSRLERPIALTCSSDAASPVALPGGEICLPRRALMELEPVEQDSMLAHEVAHVVRRDPEWLVVARVIESVLFFQPLNRLARCRLQEIAEYLCDDWAVARTSGPVTLAKCLAAVAEWVGRAPRADGYAMPAMVEAEGSPLVRRVGRILRRPSGSGERSAKSVLIGSVCVLVVLTAIAPRVSIANAATERGTLFIRAVMSERGVVWTRLSLPEATHLTRIRSVEIPIAGPSVPIAR